MKNDLIADSCEIECVNIGETAAEKWVALTRRVAETTRYPTKNFHNKNALIRHVYDLFMIEQENELGKNFIPLAKNIIHVDKEKYKTQHAEYFSDPVSEIKYSLNLLQGNEFKNHYDGLIESLAYEENPPSYLDALSLVQTLSNKVIDNFD